VFVRQELHQSYLIFFQKKDMLEKHLKRIKKSESGVSQEDEWDEIPTLGQKIEDQLIEEVPDRSLEIIRVDKNNFDAYEKDATKLKDEFSNTAQYFKIVKKHLQDKNTDFKKFKKDAERFDKEISILKPKKEKIKLDLNRLNYKEVKVIKLKQELDSVENERQEIKSRIIHFTNQIKQAQTEFDFKVEQIDDIKFELKRLEKKESLQQKIHTEQDAIDLIKQELEIIGDVKESKRVHRTVNTLVDLLNSKNQITINELNSVKDEFNKLQIKYVELMSKLK
jgi:chromosome segregation ATPase